MRLTQEAQERAAAYLCEQARPLERSLFAYHFRGGPAKDVYTQLGEYQNRDGGFGRALEPDLRLEASSVVATTVGLQVLRELEASEDHPLVRGAVRYLLDTYDPEGQVWPIIPSTANEAPHAPWWVYDEELPQRWGGFLANPRAEIVGYLYDYAGLVPDELRENLSAGVLEHLEAQADAIGMHEVLCHLRLVETKALPEGVRSSILRPLRRAVGRVVSREPSDWGGYGLKPLAVAAAPDSPFADLLAREIELQLYYEIEHQQGDGSWEPNWSWGEAYPAAWEQARREWKGVLTLRTLLALRSFGRLE